MEQILKAYSVQGQGAVVSKMETWALDLPSGGQGWGLAGKAAVCAYCTQPSAALGRGGGGGCCVSWSEAFQRVSQELEGEECPRYKE